MTSDISIGAALESEGVTASRDVKGVRRVGFDWGTNTSVVLASDKGKPVELTNDLVPTVIGRAKAGLIPGILPDGARTLYGDAALKYRLHLELTYPVSHGYVQDKAAAADFARHVREMVDPAGDHEVWAVVGAPANSGPDMQKAIRSSLVGVFEKILIVPEPFLAAMGLRDDAKAGDPEYLDPVVNSMFIDIGAGTTDLCMVQGYYPGPEQQISLAKAGNDVDDELHRRITRIYPDVTVSREKVREWKEQHSRVGKAPKDGITVKHPVGGKLKELDITEPMLNACQSIFDEVVDGVEELISRCDPDMVETLMQNMVLTGGGSCIKGLVPWLTKRIEERGYENVNLSKVDDYKRLVATGGLKMAEKVRPEQWSIPM